MSSIKHLLLPIVALLVLSGTRWCVAASSPVEAVGTAISASQWTRYDWNAASGKKSAASTIIEEKSRDYTLEIISETADDARFVQELSVEPETLYHFSCRARTEQVGTGARGAGISVLGILDGSPTLTGTSGGWQTLDFYGKTGKEQKKLSVTVGIGGYGSLNSGKAWFKEVVAVKTAFLPAGLTAVSLQPLAAPAAVPGPTGAASRGHSGGITIAVFACLGLFLLTLGVAARRRDGKETKGSEGSRAAQQISSAGPPQQGNSLVYTALMVALTVACLFVSLFRLGSHKAPETGWQSASAGESITVELGREAELSRIYYYTGINERAGDSSRFTLAAREPGGAFVTLNSFAKDQVGAWKFVDVAVRTSAIRISAEVPGGRINELAFTEKGKTAPVTGLRIGARSVSAQDQGRPENLIDEQSSFEYAPSFQTGFYFDEIYHARSAWEMLHGIEPYETTHPPLGKLLIASGIALFGMNPFGWRIVGTLFGVALVPLAYLFGLKLFRDRFYAFCAAFLLSVDFMRFAQSRVAVIDVYGVFFILALYYLLLDLFPGEGERAPRSTNRTLLMAGVVFGIGAACKWIVLYAGGGMLLLVGLCTLGELKRRDFPPGCQGAGFLLRRICVCLVAFGAIPAAIYLLSYLPYLLLPGPGHGVGDVLRLQQFMLNYHRTLHAEHPFSSPWWSWPLDLRPVWMYSGSGLPEGVVSTIASFGNPAIFWLGIPAVICAGAAAWRQRSARMGVVLTALLFQYLPWVGINRLAFIYHFFSSVPFVIFCLVATLKKMETFFPRARAVTCGYLAGTGALFLLFFPVLSGLEVSQSYLAHLKWLQSWLF
jgi:dolichyl-phosphate-mannose-protein mannosyltransferase